MDVQTYQCQAPYITLLIYLSLIGIPLMLAVLSLTAYQIPLWLLLVTNAIISIFFYRKYQRLLNDYPLQLIYQQHHRHWVLVSPSKKQNITIVSYYFISHFLLLVNVNVHSTKSLLTPSETTQQNQLIIITKQSLVSDNLSQFRQLIIAD